MCLCLFLCECVCLLVWVCVCVCVCVLELIGRRWCLSVGKRFLRLVPLCHRSENHDPANSILSSPQRKFPKCLQNILSCQNIKCICSFPVCVFVVCAFLYVQAHPCLGPLIWGILHIYSPFNKLKITMVNTSSTQNPTSRGCSSMFQSVDKIGVKKCHKIAFLGGWFELCPFRPKEKNLPFKRTKPFLAKIGQNCVLLISPLLPTVVVMSSWLPYSTYLYLDFHLCYMTKLKERNRENCWWSVEYS